MASIGMAKQDEKRGSREQILGRMPVPAGGAPPDVELSHPGGSAEKRLERLVVELTALGAHVLVAGNPAEARAYVERLAAEKGGEAMMAARPAVEALGLGGPRFHTPGSFPASEATTSVSQADYALAETGSLALFAEEGEGRTLSLVAPVNVTVLPASKIVWNVAELLEREPELAARSSALIFVTGPSRTADIELTLTVGVHGPGELHAIILTFA